MTMLIQNKPIQSIDTQRPCSALHSSKRALKMTPAHPATDLWWRGTLRYVVPIISGTVMGSMLFTPQSMAMDDSNSAITEPQLLAQQVIDGLPPPPPIPDLQIPDDASVPRGSGPQRQSTEEESGELYMVYVDGDSPLLLQQVRQVEPTATIQPYEGQQVILAGLFDRAGTANEQVNKLNQRGIEADVVSVSSVVLSPNTTPSTATNAPSQPERAALAELPPADTSQAVASRQTSPGVSLPPPTVSSPASTTVITNDPRRDDAYYIVIPGEENQLGAMKEQVVLLGAVSNSVEQRDRPLGPHLLVGPFVDQDAATRWNRYFQDFGMDARVYYKR